MIEGAPVPRHPRHPTTCLACGQLGLRFADDGRVTRSETSIPAALGDERGEVPAGLALVVMHEAMQHAALARKLSDDIIGDGTTALYAKGLRAGAPFLVEAWPGRRSGTGYFWYARIEQDGDEKANCETWWRPREPADG